MKCSKCGMLVAEKAKFCPNCGTQIIKKKKTGIFIGLGAFLFCILFGIGFWIFLFAPRKLDLNEYLVIETQGYDTVGKVHVYIDEELLYEDYGDTFKFTSEEAYRSYCRNETFFISDALDAMLNMVEITVVDNGNLKNGDIAIIDLGRDKEEFMSYFTHEIAFSEVEYEVNGLTELRNIDLYSEFDVVFSGYSPNVSMKYEQNSTSDVFSNLVYVPDKEFDLVMGEEVNFEVKTKNGEELNTYLANMGYKSVASVNSYRITGDGTYVESLEEIPSDILAQMVGQGIDAFDSYASNEYDVYDYYCVPTYIGKYFLTKKEGVEENIQNTVYIVYRIDYTMSDYNLFDELHSTEGSFYLTVKWDNLAVDMNGQLLLDLMQYEMCSQKVKIQILDYTALGSSCYMDYYTRGFKSIEEVEKNCVKTNTEKYSIVKDFVIEK